MELKINEVQLPAEITFNYEDLKTELTNRVHTYETIVYTEDQIKGAKEDRSGLNKLKKALNDERIRREKEYMVPFNDFKAKITELCGIIDVASNAVDSQIKAFEEKKKAEKKDRIMTFKADVELTHAEELQGIIIPFNDQWLNTSVSMKSIEEEINSTAESIKVNLATLATLPEFGFEAVQVYKSTLDMNKAISEAQRMAQIAKQKAEMEAEIARRKAEEAKAVSNTQEHEPEKVDHIVIDAKPIKEWLSFRAHLSLDDAKALKEFFRERNIEYTAI